MGAEVICDGCAREERGERLPNGDDWFHSEIGCLRKRSVDPFDGTPFLKDSGKREEFATGSRRDTREGKGRFDLLLMGMGESLRRLAVLLERGAKKYGERNWEKGQPISRYLDSANRHLLAAAQGRTDEDHLIQLAWNAMAAAQTMHRIQRGDLPIDLNDVYQVTDIEPKAGS